MQHTVFLVINICVAAIITYISYLRIKTRGGKSIFVLSLATLLCYSFYLQYALSPSVLLETIHFVVRFFSITVATIAIYTFSLEYTHRSHWIKWLTLSLLASIPIITQILYWLPKYFSVPAVLEAPGLLVKINVLYRYSLTLAAIWLLGRTNYLRSGNYSLQFWTMLIGPSVAFIAQGLVLLDFEWSWLSNLTLLSMNISAIGFAINSYRPNADLGISIRRGSVIEQMVDGWIILDTDNTIVDFNQATAELVDIPRKDMYGKSITSVLNDLPGLASILNKSQEIEVERTVRVNDDYRYLNIRVSAIQDDMNAPSLRLVLWRDITDRRRADDARQHARDEMFVLLNAISNAASQTTNLKEFLSDAIFQIIYPFRSQVVFIHILDERTDQKEDIYYLAAHLGLPTECSKVLDELPASSPLFEWIDQSKQYQLFGNSQDSPIPELLRDLNISSLLAIPLTFQTEKGKKLIGVLFLGRKETPAYKQDEIIRLSLLADQIATLIDSDRRRKLAISLSERQRLMRDIHDSVSQKLYGLVTLTEAAQAAIEAKSQVDFGDVLSRIGENARQAVKELRLFLFQMLPIDLEKESLVSVLHHRLAAVEGRADIKVRFLADEPIQLSKRKEVALYFIAQEALNNILRHAKAKSVSVTLKQGYKYVTLKVSDDGCGFDQDKLDQGGIGLKNMRERVKQENGKLKISSRPDKGTIVKVIFEKDEPYNSKKGIGGNYG